ncbi:MAG: tetratricopeptide repeat protein [Nitrospiraceae bacterium]
MRMPPTIVSLSVLLITAVPFSQTILRSVSAAEPDGLAQPVSSVSRSTVGQGATLAWSDLPDPGPRTEPQLTEAAELQLAHAMVFYDHAEWDAAEQHFRRTAEQFPGSVVVPMVRAFLAEISAHREQTTQRRLDVVQDYVELIRDFPGSANAQRARWRIGDLYRDLGWTAESQAAYQRAVAESTNARDAARAFLGLGMTWLAAQEWKQARHAFHQVRTGTEQETLVQWATLGEAAAHYGEGRWEEAAALAESVMRRWPMAFRACPSCLLELAEIENKYGRGKAARQLWSIFVNLYPRDERASRALLAWGESLDEDGQIAASQTLYRTVIVRFPNSLEAGRARLRLTEVGQDLAKQAGERRIALEVQMSFDVQPPLPVAFEQRVRVLRAVSQEQAFDALASEALVRLGEQFQEAGKEQEAIHHFLSACRRDGVVSGDPWPAVARRRLADLAKPALEAALRSADDWRVVLAFHRSDVCVEHLAMEEEFVIRGADAHRRLGFSAGAVELYQQVLHRQLGSRWRQEALIGLGRAYLDQDDPEAARRVFERYQLENPLGPYRMEALHYLADVWNRLGDARSVVKVCRRWLKLHDAQPTQDAQYNEMLLQLAEAQASLGAHAEAAATFDLAERVGAITDVPAILRFADVLAQAGRTAAAAARYGDVIRLAPSSNEAEHARFRLSRLWLTQGQYDEAVLVADKGRATARTEVLRRAMALITSTVRTEQARERGTHHGSGGLDRAGRS